MCCLVYLVFSQTGATHLTRGVPLPLPLPLPTRLSHCHFHHFIDHRQGSSLVLQKFHQRGPSARRGSACLPFPTVLHPEIGLISRGSQQAAGPTLVSTEPRPAGAGTAGFAPETGTGRITSRLAKAPRPSQLDETVGHGVGSGWSHVVSVTVRCSTSYSSRRFPSA